MNTVTENGKDYLVTYFAKLDDQHIDAAPLFADLESALQEIRAATGAEHLDRNAYGANLQAILTRFSGDYFSPSMLKSYETNPAAALVSSLIEEFDDSTPAAIGSKFHLIMEKFYSQSDRSKQKLFEIENDLVLPEQKQKVHKYILGYLATPDYLDNDAPLEIRCECELRNRSEIQIPRFGAKIPTCSCVIDRIDHRNSGLYIVDYKTGSSVSRKSTTFEGNLAQMIIYRWVVEQTFDEEVRRAYLCAPGSKRYLECDIGEENQRSLLDQIDRFFEHFRADRSAQIYEYTDRGYLFSGPMRDFRALMKDSSISMAKVPIKVYIGEHADR